MEAPHSYEENVAAADRHLRRFANATLNHLIGGEATPSESGATFENSSPIDGARRSAIVSSGDDAADIDEAATSRRRARSVSLGIDAGGAQRKRVLARRSGPDRGTSSSDRRDRMRRHRSDDAIHERGSPCAALRTSGSSPTRRPARLMACRCRLGSTSTTPTRKPLWARLGVITPWNTPFMLSTWKIAPALAAGCTVVHKPAEWSPYTAHLLRRDRARSRPSHQERSTSSTAWVRPPVRALTEHPSIKAIAFVGESSTGSMIQAQGAPTLKRVHFELGGKNPVIVFDDADLDRALDAVIFMIYSLNGERCTSSSRVLDPGHDLRRIHRTPRRRR